MAPALEALKATEIGDTTAGELIALMRGEAM